MLIIFSMKVLKRYFAVWFLSFALTFVVGLAAISGLELLMPGFTETEATAMVGRRVSNGYSVASYSLSKCAPSGSCSAVKVGERGTVIRALEISPGSFFLVVQWDDSNRGEPMLSYVSRKVRRTFLNEE